MNFQSLTQHGDTFGDEDKGFDLLGNDSEQTWIEPKEQRH